MGLESLQRDPVMDVVENFSDGLQLGFHTAFMMCFVPYLDKTGLYVASRIFKQRKAK